MTERERFIIDYIKKWEGGFGTDGRDCGGTLSGVTLCTYRHFFGKDKSVEDLKKMTDEEWIQIFRAGFYDKIKGDEIYNDSLCLLIVDWCWMSGVKTAIRKVQSAIGCVADGIVGKKTLFALNSNAKDAFYKIWGRRKYFYEKLVEKNPENKKYINGWLRRLKDIKYIPKCNCK